MDDETVRMLTHLPADLRIRGWQFVPAVSRASESSSWHRAVYRRPFDDRVDTGNEYAAVYDRLNRQHIVRVSTVSEHSPIPDATLTLSGAPSRPDR